MGHPLNAPWLQQAVEKGLVDPADLARPATAPGLGSAEPGDLAGLLAAVRAAGFGEPVREHRFDVRGGRQWRFDLAWMPEQVAFEREGGAFRPVRCDCGRTRTVFVSRHHSRDGLEEDVEKYTAAALQGWLVVRGTPRQIADGRAAALLIEALESRRVSR